MKNGTVTNCDAANASLDLWIVAKGKPLSGYIIPKTAQKSRLAKNGLDDCIDYCHTPNLTQSVPVLSQGKLIPLLCDCNKLLMYTRFGVKYDICYYFGSIREIIRQFS
jgi:hypothetical protein